MTAPALDALLKIAEAATPGPWLKAMSGDGLRVYQPQHPVVPICKWAGDSPAREKNIDFIAAFNPTVAQALVRVAMASVALVESTRAISPIDGRHNGKRMPDDSAIARANDALSALTAALKGVPMADATPEPRVSDVDWATHIVVTKRQWTEVHATIASQAEALAAKEAEVERLRGVSYGMDDDTHLVLEKWREAAMNAAADGDEKTWVEPLALLSLLANVRGLFARVSIAEAALKAAREAADWWRERVYAIAKNQFGGKSVMEEFHLRIKYAECALSEGPPSHPNQGEVTCPTPSSGTGFPPTVQ